MNIDFLIDLDMYILMRDVIVYCCSFNLLLMLINFIQINEKNEQLVLFD